MPDPAAVMEFFALVVVAAPAALLLALGVPSLLDRPLSEATTGRLTRWLVAVALVAVVAVFVGMLATGNRHVVLDLGEWVSVYPPGADDDHPGYHFQIQLVFDRLSVPFAALSLVLCGTVGAFAIRYMHREPGFNRFFVLYAAFTFGMVGTALAGTIETLFAGWELVGLSSVFLVAFFHERPAPCRNGLRVWVVYRVADAALLLAAILMHRMTGSGEFVHLVGGPWPAGQSSVSETGSLVIGLLLLAAAAGKSALVPFSGWLPRAMEGPTPSSAIFYGALSVHLGAYLLLRASPLIDASPELGVAVVTLGVLTAVFAYVAGSVQTDIKSALSFASLAQVGVIVAEIGLGWHYVPLVHLLGHACMRTLQFIRAPSLLQDYRHLENAIGGRLSQNPGLLVRLLPARARVWLYRFALERGYLDALLDALVVRPFVKLFRWFDRLERRATDSLAGPKTEELGAPPVAEPEPVAAPPEPSSSPRDAVATDRTEPITHTGPR